MKKIILLLPAMLMAVTSHAIEYDQNITAIFGAGNPDTGWVTSDTDNNIELGLRAKDRTTGATPNNGAGTFYFPASVLPGAMPWNFEWSINSDVSDGTDNLLTYIYQLEVDTNPGAGTLFTAFNPLLYTDSSLGNNLTANGQGVETGAFNAFNIAQNSQNITFFPFLVDPFAVGEYDFKLSAYNRSGTLRASTEMTVVVGREQPSNSVPDGGATLGLLGAGVVGLFSLRRFQKS